MVLTLNRGISQPCFAHYFQLATNYRVKPPRINHAFASPLMSYFHRNATATQAPRLISTRGWDSIHLICFREIDPNSEETRVCISMVYTITQSLLSKDGKGTQAALANVWHFNHKASALPEQWITPPGASGVGIQCLFFGAEPKITGEVKLAGQAEVCDLLPSGCAEREEKVAGHHPQSSHVVHLYMVNGSVVSAAERSRTVWKTWVLLQLLLSQVSIWR